MRERTRDRMRERLFISHLWDLFILQYYLWEVVNGLLAVVSSNRRREEPRHEYVLSVFLFLSFSQPSFSPGFNLIIRLLSLSLSLFLSLSFHSVQRPITFKILLYYSWRQEVNEEWNEMVLGIMESAFPFP